MLAFVSQIAHALFRFGLGNFLNPAYFSYFSLGTFTWLLWLLRRIKGIGYEPAKDGFHATTSVIIPVYKEKTDVLSDTLLSVLANRPDEVITVIDHTDKALISFVMLSFSSVRVIVAGKPGKRPALAEGIRAAKSDIVVLVDSDTQWQGADFLPELLKPFADPKVGGVASGQSVANADVSLATRIADWWLDIRYLDYMPGQSSEGVVSCISGRTGAYRREVVVPLLDDLVNERFWNRQCVGGDDGRLTLLVLKSGYKTMYQATAQALTSFTEDFSGLVKQRIRWSRNSYRAYLRAIKEGWIFRRHWILPVSIIHMVVSPLVLILSVFAMAFAILTGNFLVFSILVIWALAGRLVKGLSHLSRKRLDVLLLPVFEAYNRLIYPIIKAYALLTMYRQDWLGSRGDYSLSTRQVPAKHTGNGGSACGQCARPVPTLSRFCDTCGAPLKPFVEITDSREEPKKN